MLRLRVVCGVDGTHELFAFALRHFGPCKLTPHCPSAHDTDRKEQRIELKASEIAFSHITASMDSIRPCLFFLFSQLFLVLLNQCHVCFAQSMPCMLSGGRHLLRSKTSHLTSAAQHPIGIERNGHTCEVLSSGAQARFCC